MNRIIEPIHIIGGGMAGSEAAWQAARAGVPVVLHEMRPDVKTDAHQTDGLAKLVCSNSFRSDDAANNAVGVNCRRSSARHWKQAGKGARNSLCRVFSPSRLHALVLRVSALNRETGSASSSPSPASIHARI